jgi:hypothetical protein
MARPMPVVLANDEEGRLDDEPEVAVLEGRAVPLAHEESNQALVALRHLVRGLVERDPRPVDHCEVGRKRSVEGDEAVIEDRDDVLS